jgi:hypothetical protein
MAVEIDLLRKIRFLEPLKDRNMRRPADSMREHTIALAERLADAPGAP